MLGYGAVAEHYPLSFPRVLRDAGYLTVAIGKDHFGWNITADAGIAHGYEKTSLYDGLGARKAGAEHEWSGEFDDYDRAYTACPRARGSGRSPLNLRVACGDRVV
jgi:arylsulfatase A-like enzyme